MEASDFAKENAGFGKNAIRMEFDALKTLTGQAAVASDMLLGASPIIPVEGKKAVGVFFREGQKGLENLQSHLERTLDLDWTDKDALVKNLDSMQTLCANTFRQFDEVKKETGTLLENATRLLPTEAKSLLETWNASVNSGFEFFQGYVNNNFEMARKALSGISAFAPGPETPTQ